MADEMSLVSGFYRLAPSDWSGGQDERRVRLKRALRRLVAQEGMEQVQITLQTYKSKNDTEAAMVAWMLLEVGK